MSTAIPRTGPVGGGLGEMTCTVRRVRWQWYSDVAFELTPYWFERNRYPQGKPLADRPPLEVDAYGYGFDAQDRVAVLREFSGFLNGSQTCETAWTYEDDLIEEVRTDSDGQVGYTHRFRLADGLLRSQEMTARYGSGEESYTFEGGLLTGIDVLHNGRPWQTVSVGHDEYGTLQRIETTWLQQRGHTDTTYQRPPQGFTLAGQADVVAAVLQPWILAEVGRLQLDEPAYCLALSYEDHCCLPELGVGLDSERREWLQMDEADCLWNPAEFHHYGWDGEPVSPAIAAAANLLDQECALGGDRATVRGMLNALARRLNRHYWASVLPTTPDFLVYAVDVHLNDLDANLREARPQTARSSAR